MLYLCNIGFLNLSGTNPEINAFLPGSFALWLMAERAL